MCEIPVPLPTSLPPYRLSLLLFLPISLFSSPFATYLPPIVNSLPFFSSLLDICSPYLSSFIYLLSKLSLFPQLLLPLYWTTATPSLLYFLHFSTFYPPFFILSLDLSLYINSFPFFPFLSTFLSFSLIPKHLRSSSPSPHRHAFLTPLTSQTERSPILICSHLSFLTTFFPPFYCLHSFIFSYPQTFPCVNLPMLPYPPTYPSFSLYSWTP